MYERNIVILRGFLGAIQPRTVGQQTVARVGINVKEFFMRDGELTSSAQWFDVEFWNEHIRVAEGLKARTVQVEIRARLVNDSWTDTATGKQRTALKLKGVDICAYTRQTALDAEARQAGLDTPPEESAHPKRRTR